MFTMLADRERRRKLCDAQHFETLTVNTKLLPSPYEIMDEDSILSVSAVDELGGFWHR